MVESTVVWNKFPDALPAESKEYLAAFQCDGTCSVCVSLWLPKFKIFSPPKDTFFSTKHVIAWAEMPIYTEGK